MKNKYYMKNNDYMKNHDKQVDNFLAMTGTKINKVFVKNGKHFGDNDHERDIWSITLSNKKHIFTFNFGQSIANKGERPSNYDILAGLSVYDYDNVDDFAVDFGYEKPSEALRAFTAVRNETMNLKKLFNNEELELLAEIQ